MTGPKTVSDKQLAANRANARKSTGPRTPQGKARSSQNAVKHGILARAVLPSALEAVESREDFDQLLASLTDLFAPEGIVEVLLVQQIAAAYWRLARLYRAEAGDIALIRDEPDYSYKPSPFLRIRRAPDPGTLDALWLQREALLPLLEDPEALRAAWVARDPQMADATDEELITAVRARIDAIGERFDAYSRHRQEILETRRSLPGLDTALKFARYETALQRQLDRALTRLEHLQCQRGVDPVASAHLLAPPDFEEDA